MVSIDTSTLQSEIEADLTAELSTDTAFSASVLSVKVKNAIRDVVMRRNYSATRYTAEQIVADLYNYYPTISALALYDYNQIGANYEVAHNENSINRTWVSRDDLLKGVHAFVQCI